MISTKGRYARRAMIDIACNEKKGFVSLKDISRRQEISMKYLEQIIPLMIKSGLLVSSRGNNGGYHLAKDPKDISAYDVLIASIKTLAPVECLSKDEMLCKRCNECTTISLWREYYQVTKQYFSSKSLQDLMLFSKEEM